MYFLLMGYIVVCISFCVVDLIICLAFSNTMLILHAKCSDIIIECLVLDLTFFVGLTSFFRGILLCWYELKALNLLVFSNITVVLGG